MTDSTAQASNTLVVIQPDGTETREIYTGDEPELERLQKAVGGYLEHIMVLHEGRELHAFINEEGKLRGLDVSARATQIYNDWLRKREREATGVERSHRHIYDVVCGPIAILVPAPTDGALAAQANHDAKLDAAREVLSSARADLGHDLAGFSITDLLADNFPWSLEQCRQIARELA